MYHVQRIWEGAVPSEELHLEKVVVEKKLREVGGVFMFFPTTTSALFVLRKHYSTLFYRYEQVKALCDWTDFALHDWEDNVKALFRQGQTYMTLNDIDTAVESFKKALELEPNDGQWCYIIHLTSYWKIGSFMN
ncbi:peptidyl-prolyl cis-trans isomerase CYP40-like [Pyrus ussuriensis x Pyrus communis]|uniref:Peptidyl-prolyl cis-trans isomerase CYP40-like n=2 Tax=Pyrus TaxID=3766 RepID=A0A5N5HA30_9ROSA|nr:peptidyl-prolyl cis-trans isomerase CYP40-like [Pyrus ussuriensis x Pyrus communis]